MTLNRLQLHLVACQTVVATAVLAISGCGGPAARPDCDVSEQAGLTVHATDRANPDAEGRPLPTVIRVYQLANIGTMETATFDEIWETDEDTLGEAFLGKDELTIYPDTTQTRAFERNPDANYIVGVAIVRRPTGVSWRSILDMPPPAQEARCEALQENPEAEPPEDPMVYVRFELDDYQIEGSVRFEYPPSEDDPLGGLVDEPDEPSTPEADTPSTPDTSTPSMPSTGM